MKLTVLYRRGMMNPAEDEAEIQAAEKAGLDVVHYRTQICGGVTVARYSCLPFYKELASDIARLNSSLINTYRQHQFVADMREWCHALGDMTPRLYERLQDLPEKGPFVLKGQTNSKKHLWNTHMFALDKRAAGEVYSRLQDDMLLSQQQIYARDYVPLKRLAVGFNGLPISNEFRFFVFNGKILTGAFYWASHVDDLQQVPSASQVPQEFLQKAISRIGDLASFYTLDVAETASGDWTVVEVNDGQMAGLSCNSADSLYGALAASWANDWFDFPCSWPEI